MIDMIINIRFALFTVRFYYSAVPLADAKLSGPRDAFKKGLQITSFLSLLKRDDIIWNLAMRPLMHQGRFVTSNRATRGRIVNNAGNNMSEIFISFNAKIPFEI